ncbi:delta-1-pyrroline-5-carboxylate dehydrogenase [Anaerobranca californiensis DSM 14826]|jgi:1-pyrroline-5-carboxylate dehydrogenase|uniref:L-glutamate gamma-semialdehyde dehydrogenase n=1 Tax=Anaerobranca californiensis DSM 14826 TaxID=1120989 RepID=A0A1M6M5T0_9FIRM|nr:L-glutamate gamma-semialdehyde dehydrogenase [Anaerobranca californiensis]SHJ78836.1 delta-1-pyrroline-5-carboxylate dehydrogenase [Anaerobranca californiensis DSM 14826]
MLKSFTNEEFLDFTNVKVQQKALTTLNEVRKGLGKDYPLIIGKEKIFTEEKIISTNPANPEEIIGYVSKGNKDLAQLAMEEGVKAFSWWKKIPVEERVRYLIKGAEILRKRKLEFASLLVLEIGKSWREADADVAEAIDFLEYYGRQALLLQKEPFLIPYPGEENWARYIPLGVGVIIPPWNFPLAILVGMVSAAIVTGNTVVLKPASITPVIGYKFVELMEEAGLPSGVINFLPGSGGEIGDFLVKHAKTRFINFTGSKEVGLRINKLAAEITKGQRWIKRVVAEMGGKDGIIVDEDVNLEEAVKIVVTSAYGFQGQKCSACSRVIVHQRVYDEFIEKLVEEVKKIKVGVPEDFNNFMGPVSDKNAFNNILKYIEIGKGEGKLVYGGNRIGDSGYFIQPTVIIDVPPEGVIAQEEIFGPVLAVIKAKDFDEALKIANNTEFGLTGGVCSNNRSNLEKAREEFYVGNLYFNRKITGALVGVQPFGGYNMSGTCSKAGGPDYLQLFTQMKVVTEKF